MIIVITLKMLGYKMEGYKHLPYA